MSTKIQKLVTNWPNGLVRAVSGLKKLGFSQDLITHYRKSGWLESIGEGALIKAGDTPTIYGAIWALQNDLKFNVHIGSLSSFELLGKNYHVPFGEQRVYLFGEKKRLPKWFTTYNFQTKIFYSSATLFNNKTEIDFKNYDFGSFKLKISGEVRAMIEFLHNIGKKHSFELDHAKHLMSAISTVRPVVVNTLLQECYSIKIKRLFLLLAENYEHSWVKRIEYDKINIGKGARNLTKAGKLHKKYQITLPPTLLIDF